MVRDVVISSSLERRRTLLRERDVDFAMRRGPLGGSQVDARRNYRTRSSGDCRYRGLRGPQRLRGAAVTMLFIGLPTNGDGVARPHTIGSSRVHG